MWTGQAGTDARVEGGGQLADGRLAGGEAFDRTGAGARADGLSAFEVWPVMRAVPGIVAMHASAFPGDHARRQAVVARSLATGEAVAGGQGETGKAVAGGSALGCGALRAHETCILGTHQRGGESLGGGFAAVAA